MRIQCNPLSLFLLGLAVTSIVEASGGKPVKKKVKKMKRKGKHFPPSSILHDNSAMARNEVLVPQIPKISHSSSFLSFDSSSVGRNGLLPALHQVSTTSDLSFLDPSLKTGSASSLPTLELESSKRNDEEIYIAPHSSSFSSSFLSSAGESDVAQDVIEALEENGFEGIKRDWCEKWEYRKDLFDYVVMKSVEFITKFINKVEVAREPTFAALFIKSSDEVDQVLKKIEYTDFDLIYSAEHRPELAEPPYILFNVIDKIKNPENQETAVEWGVTNLFYAKKYDSVIPLINALEERQFNGMNLKSVAIQWAFYQGASRGIKNIVERFHEHSAITHEEYAKGLIESWNWDKLKTALLFLLDQADQGDLESVKEDDKYKKDQEFRKAIDGAFSNAESAGARHARPAERAERAELAMKTFSGIPGLEPLGKKDTLGGIISGYLG
jgi:hypothetical protein